MRDSIRNKFAEYRRCRYREHSDVDRCLFKDFEPKICDQGSTEGTFVTIDVAQCPSWIPSGRPWNKAALLPWLLVMKSVARAYRCNGGARESLLTDRCAAVRARTDGSI